jgi:ABC-type spermidine/putrescine transport system permease subunit II
MAVWAFYGTDILGKLAARPTLHWFVVLLSDPQWLSSLTYSLLLSSAVSLSSATFLFLLFYATRFAPRKVETIIYVLTIIPVILPAVIYAMALKVVCGRLGIPEMAVLFCGNLVLTLPLQYFILESAQDNVPDSRLDAGLTLGASHLSNLWNVFLPPLKKTLLSVLLIGIVLSFDEIVLATFIIDSPLVTVPRRLWDQVGNDDRPFAAVIGMLLLTTALCAVAAIRTFQWLWTKNRSPR